ncbi:MAG: hypothetical protein ACTSO8_02325 [Promethearchaeota archaeon]
MDTEYDFITPEFLNILFFQQKNLVIFPYVDLKHLRSLQVFAVGYDVVDIDSAVLYNLNEIIEYEASSYSQQPTFYFVLNPKTEEIERLIDSAKIHCVVNTRENVESLAKGDQFVFYNKKSKTFVNYEPEKQDLSFERHLIRFYPDKQLLLDEILKIKSLATKIFLQLNESSNSDNLPKLLRDYDQIYWNKILNFTRLYYDIEIPNLDRPKQLTRKNMKPKPEKDYSAEYEVIMKGNRKIGQKFVQLIHDYRFEKVNPANLEVPQLFYPKKLYNYLRNHHWEKGIPQEFVFKWLQMIDSKFQTQTSENDLLDFQIIFEKLKIPLAYLPDFPEVDKENKSHNNTSLRPIVPNVSNKNESVKGTIEPIPSVENFKEFKSWLLKKLDDLETIL